MCQHPRDPIRHGSHSPLGRDHFVKSKRKTKAMPDGIFISTVFVLVIGLFLSLSCGQQDEKSAIRELIQKAAGLAEKLDIRGLLKMTTGDFLAMPGALDQRSCKGILWRAFQYYGEMNIVYPTPVIDLKAEGKNASVWVPFLVLRKGQSFPDMHGLSENPRKWLEKAGEAADLYRLKMEFIKQGKAWSVREAHLGRFSGLDFEK